MSAGLAERANVEVIELAAWDRPVLVQTIESLLGLVRLARRLASRSHRPDVVHLHVSSGGSLYRKVIAGRLAHRQQIPVLVHLHSGGFGEWTRRRRLHRTIARRMVRSASGVVLVAHFWEPLALELEARRVFVIPHLLSPRLAQALDAQAGFEPRPGGHERLVTVLFYGRWAPIKGLDLLGAAIAALPSSQQARLRVRVFGNGDADWARRCFSRADPAELLIGGWLSDEAKPRELSCADAVALPSRQEAFAGSLVEAIAAGTPIIASDAGAIPEVLGDYPLAITTRRNNVADLASALGDLIDGKWPIRDGRRMRLPERYTAKPVVDALIEAYEAVAGTTERSTRTS